MWEETPGRLHDLVQRRLRGGTVGRGAPAQRGDPGRGGAGLGFRRSVVRLKRGPAGVEEPGVVATGAISIIPVGVSALAPVIVAITTVAAVSTSQNVPTYAKVVASTQS